ncbi:MAG TPA: phosphoribosyltransferase family protein [Pyrinomonadaceae bacterium]
MRFTDPGAAGRELAEKVEARGSLAGAVVLAVARGGVPVAAEVAKRLRAPLDVVLVRRLLVPRGPEEPVCAVSVAGALVLDKELAARRAARDDDDKENSALESFLAEALREFEARTRACRGDRPPLDLSRRQVLLVDNGVRTGSTLRAVLRALRTREPARVVAAFPVASVEGRASVAAVADESICLATPEPFGHVGLWYANFERQDDRQIAAALDEAERARGGLTRA